MGKIPYVTSGELFVRADYKHAEEILAEYNDFYIFNMAQYNTLYHKIDEHVENEDEIEAEVRKRLELADRAAKQATEHFAGLFGSKDFGESAMIGLRISWYDLQKILLAEFKHKTLVQDSAMNGIAPHLRNVASIMLFAERIIADLDQLDGTFEQIAVLKEGFKMLLERNEKEKLAIPEYHKAKTAFARFKKPEQYIEFCEKLFFGKL
ncbi:MAG: hypothetical protein LBG88_01490 [Christensenellaceae bacterium]|jgi:hypothetical protein|nr:hypothetical protein [Christensenellaceae bacterium]